MMTIQDVKKMASDVMLKQGSHLAQLIMCGENGSGIAVLPDMPDKPDEKEKLFGMAGVRLAMEGGEKLGMLKKLYFISEGWMSVVSKKKMDKDDYVQPSKDPKRIECLIIASHELETNHGDMIILEIQRDKKQKFIGLKDISPKNEGKGEAKSYMLDAFIKGYEMATLKMASTKMEQGLKDFKRIIN